MKIIYLSLLSVAILGVANASAQQQMTVAQQKGLAAERSSYADQSIARNDTIRLQLELADRAAKIADEIKQATLAAQAAKEARDADLEKEIERCLAAGLPCPTEATWVKPTAYEQDRAKFANSMRERMNARMRAEYSNPGVTILPNLPAAPGK